MFKKQLTIAFTISLAAFLGTTTAVQLRQLTAPALDVALEAAPVFEAAATQDVNAAATFAPAQVETSPLVMEAAPAVVAQAAPIVLEAAPVTPLAPFEAEMETADNFVMSDEVFEVEKGKKIFDDEDGDEDDDHDDEDDEKQEKEEDDEELEEKLFDTWDGENVLREILEEAKEHIRKESRRHKSRRHHREEEEEEEEEERDSDDDEE